MALVVGLVTVWAVMVVIGVIRAMDESERQLHTTTAVCEVMMAFVETHQRWPNRWDELVAEAGTHSVGVYEWPRDEAALHQAVVVDFGVTLEQVAEADARDAMFVRPRGESRGLYRHYGLSMLIDAVRELVRKGNSPPDN